VLLFFGRRASRLGFVFGSGEAPAERQRNFVIERTGVGLLVGDTQYGQEIDDDVGLDLQLAGQLVNSDLTHTWLIPAH
jgi:hypothetical protein